MISIEKIYRAFLENPIVTTDSRYVPVNSIFFGLKGDNFDGNKFAIDALNSGARLAIVDDPSIIHEKCICVDDSLRALQAIATVHRKALGVRIIAITGSNGKTTTKELINAVLSTQYKTYATKGNLNNHIGVPLTLLSITSDIQMAIVEMGANHPGEIATLANIAQPEYGIITNIGNAHLGGFGSFDGVKKTKGELYEYLTHNNGKIFINTKNQILLDLAEQFKLEKLSIGYGLNKFALSEDKENESPFLKVKYQDNSNLAEIQTNLVGNYNFENIFAAVTIGVYFGIPIQSIKKAVESYVPSNSRSQLIKKESNTIILDAYNANPTSMRASLVNLSNLKYQNKIAILGEMKELGSYSENEHKTIAELAESLNLNNIFYVGSEFKKHVKPNVYFESSADLIDYLKKIKIRNSLILVKGSRAVKLETILDYL